MNIEEIFLIEWELFEWESDAERFSRIGKVESESALFKMHMGLGSCKPIIRTNPLLDFYYYEDSSDI